MKKMKKNSHYFDFFSIILALLAIALVVSLIKNVDASTTLLWKQDWSRVDKDNTEISVPEREGHTIIHGRSPSSLNDSLSIPYSPDVSSHTFTDLENGVNYFALITNDMGGRSSAVSAVVFSEETDGITIEKPPYPEFVITRIGDSLDYSLDFPEIDNAYKYYLYNNGIYVTEIRQSNYDTAIPFILHLDAKEYNWSMETESKINGLNVSSDRSPVQNMTAGVDESIDYPSIEPPIIDPPVVPVDPVVPTVPVTPPIESVIIILVPEGGATYKFMHE